MFYQQFLDRLADRYPSVYKHHFANHSHEQHHELLFPNLLSPFRVPIAKSTLDSASLIVAAFDRLRNSKTYIAHIRHQYPDIHPTNAYSALMSFDFHLTASGQLKLIEINTNASMGLVGELIYQTHGLENYFGPSFDQQILDTFKTEHQLFLSGRMPFDNSKAATSSTANSPLPSLKSIAIIDETPEKQKLYIEFLLYQELFEKHGLKCEIMDFKNCRPQDWDLVYNRHTDFLFVEPESQHLRQAYDDQQTCFSPNPFEYLALAAKERLLELQHIDLAEKFHLDQMTNLIIQNTILKSYAVQKTDPEWLWQNRKSLFFKPQRSFGGKAVFHGDTLRRKAFAAVLEGDYIAQDLVVPPQIEFQNETNQKVNFKYDLRFYAYRNKIQLGMARLFQGPMTNMRTAGGGWAALDPV